MFAIIISEKGGAERRESFDKSEINVGRVQGNDLMLPKGNVSKHHARLLFRDGRFIVTDLKSTNGTYVNGRKIAQATIVREGDKIYIGDFVLRLETAANQQPAIEATSAGAEEESIRTLARDNLPPPPRPANAPAVTLKAPTHPPGAPLPRPQVSNVSNAPPQVQVAPPPAETPARFSLDQDPDDSAPLVKPRMPSIGGDRPPSLAPPPPPIGGGSGPSAPAQRPMTMPLNQMSAPMMGRPPTGPGGPQQPPTAQAMQPSAPPPPLPPAAPPPVPSSPPPVVQPGPPPFAPPANATSASAQPPVVDELDEESQMSPAAPPNRPTAAPPARTTGAPGRVSVAPRESPAQAGRRLALTMLMGRIADAVDLSALRSSPVVPDSLASQIERAAREQATAMREEGEAPQDIDLDAVARDAHRELVGLGAFGPLLEDDDVIEIHALRHDQVFVVRAGHDARTGANEGPGFSSEEALHRVIARLAAQSGEAWRPGETVLERRLPRATFVAVAPPAAAGHLVSIRKRRRIESTLEELLQRGALSRPMAQFLEAALAARVNVLVSGVASATVLSALASLGGAGERVCVVQDVEEIGVGHAFAVPLAVVETQGRKIGEDTVRAAARLQPDRLVVTQLAGGVAAATLDAVTEGTEGVLAGIAAPSLRQALSRLVAQLVLQRPGLGLEATREVVGEAFDLAVEVTVAPDGRVRITRIAELGGSDAKGIVARDVFVWTEPQGPGEGSHGATGVVPRLSADLAARGQKLDASLFKRAGR